MLLRWSTKWEWGVGMAAEPNEICYYWRGHRWDPQGADRGTWICGSLL